MPLVFLFAMGIAEVALADTYQPKIELGPFAGELEIGPKMVVAGHRLWGSEIVGQDLRGAVFDDCDLADLTLAQCDLTGATFRRAVLKDFCIDDCTLGDNDFTDAVVNGMKCKGLGLTEQQLKSTWSYKNKQLDDCKVPNNKLRPGYDFSGFSLYRTEFYGLTQCRFDGADIYQASFRSCDLTQCRFDRAHLREVSFESCTIDLSQLWSARAFHTSLCRFVDMKFVGEIDLSGKYLRSSALSGNFSEVNVTGATIYDISAGPWLNQAALTSTKSYAVGELSRIKLGGCDLSDVDFSRQVLIKASFRRCNFTGCKFEDAVVSGAKFDDSCNGLTADQIKSTWNYKHGRMAGITLPEDIAKALADE